MCVCLSMVAPRKIFFFEESGKKEAQSYKPQHKNHSRYRMKTGFPLVSHWFPTNIPSVSQWFPTGFSTGFPAGFPIGFPFGFKV